MLLLIFDYLFSTVAWLALVFALLGLGKGVPGTVSGFGIVFLMALRGRGLLGSLPPSGRAVWNLLTGFGAGLGVFVSFIGLQMISWPLVRATRLGEQGFLSYCHAVLVLTVTACLLWLAFRPGMPHYLRWGHWGRGGILLTLIALGCGGVAACYVMRFRTGFTTAYTTVFAIALVKATLTGVGEEAFSRIAG